MASRKGKYAVNDVERRGHSTKQHGTGRQKDSIEKHIKRNFPKQDEPISSAKSSKTPVKVEDRLQPTAVTNPLQTRNTPLHAAPLSPLYKQEHKTSSQTPNSRGDQAPHKGDRHHQKTTANSNTRSQFSSGSRPTSGSHKKQHSIRSKRGDQHCQTSLESTRQQIYQPGQHGTGQIGMYHQYQESTTSPREKQKYQMTTRQAERDHHHQQSTGNTGGKQPRAGPASKSEHYKETSGGPPYTKQQYELSTGEAHGNQQDQLMGQTGRNRPYQQSTGHTEVDQQHTRSEGRNQRNTPRTGETVDPLQSAEKTADASLGQRQTDNQGEMPTVHESSKKRTDKCNRHLTTDDCGYEGRDKDPQQARSKEIPSRGMPKEGHVEEEPRRYGHSTDIDNSIQSERNHLASLRSTSDREVTRGSRSVYLMGEETFKEMLPEASAEKFQEPEPMEVDEVETLPAVNNQLELRAQKELQKFEDEFKKVSVKDKDDELTRKHGTEAEWETTHKNYKSVGDSSWKGSDAEMRERCTEEAFMFAQGEERPQQDEPTVSDLPTPNRQMSGEDQEKRDKLSFIRSHCRKEYDTKPMIYIADTREIFNDTGSNIRKMEFGKKNQTSSEKVVMLVGATGSGKSTMINAVFNYMFGIEWEDEYRLKLIEEGPEVNQAVSQTNMITAYTIHHQPWFRVPYTMTLVDTPGFGDTGGLKRDQQIMEQIRKFFTLEDFDGIDHLDAVGFVTQSSVPRLSPTQRYVFDSILSIFGKDIAQNIFMLLTFADGQKPQVLSGLKEAKMDYKSFYKFNNSALYVGNKEGDRYDMGSDDEEEEEYTDDEDDDDNNFDKMFWKMGAGNFNKFMRDLDTIQPQSLVLTSEVLEERNELEITINGIHENIKMGLKKLEQLKMERKILKQHQTDIEKSRNFTYEVKEPMVKPVRMAHGEYATNCTYCNFTCLKRCSPHMVSCKAMDWWGNCKICPGRCRYTMHQNEQFRYKIVMVKGTKTSFELKKRYEEAEGKKLTAKQLIEKCSEEFEMVQIATLDLTEQARKCLKRLNEIALKPNPLSTTDYIDLMIQEEEFVAGPGWKDTVKQLEEIKKRTNFTQQLTDEGYDPFAGYKPMTKRQDNSRVVAGLYKNLKRQKFQETTV